jgi:hypothetical protein
MAMGQAAGTAAALAIELGVQPRRVPVYRLQERLLDGGAVLIYFEDAQPGDDHFRAVQFLAVRGFLGDERQARLDQIVDEKTASRWIASAGAGPVADYKAGKTTRGQLLDLLYDSVKKLPPERIERIFAN